MEKFTIKPIQFRVRKNGKTKVSIQTGVGNVYEIKEAVGEDEKFAVVFNLNETIGIRETEEEAERLANEHHKEQLIQVILEPFEEVPSDSEVDIQKYYEDNCIKINSADDLPKEDCSCWILDKVQGWKTGRWVQLPNGREFINASEFWVKHATHYIIVPKPNENKEA